jgi:hypothetical protein
VVAVGEDVRLEGQEGPAAVDQVDARQPVLGRDLLRPEVLLDGQRVVGPALDRRVVGDHDARRPLDPADAGHDPGARRLVVVEAVGGQRAQLQEVAAGVEQPVDPFTDGQLAPASMAGDGIVVATGTTTRDGGLALAQVGHEGGHRLVVRSGSRVRRVEAASQHDHARIIEAADVSAGAEPRRPARCPGSD